MYFCILKKRWWILNYGFQNRDMSACENIFVICCCINNFMLDRMDHNNSRVGRGGPLGGDGLWLDGPTVNEQFASRVLENQFSDRRMLLAKHLCVFKLPITDVVSEGEGDDES